MIYAAEIKNRDMPSRIFIESGSFKFKISSKSFGITYFFIFDAWDEQTGPLARLFLSSNMLWIRSGFVLAEYLPV